MKVGDVHKNLGYVNSPCFSRQNTPISEKYLIFKNRLTNRPVFGLLEQLLTSRQQATPVTKNWLLSMEVIHIVLFSSEVVTNRTGGSDSIIK